MRNPQWCRDVSEIHLWSCIGLSAPRELEARARPIERRRARPELFDATDVELDWPIGTTRTPRAMEETERILPKLLAVINDAFPEQIAPFQVVVRKHVPEGEQFVNLLTLPVLVPLDELHWADLD